MSKALLRYIRLSPTKARLVAREVQGMNAELAIASLEFTPNKAARIISKVIASAVANGGFDAQNVYVTSCRVDAGPVLRRFMPRAKGRATPIRKPTSHILVEVEDKPIQKNAKKTSVKNENSKTISKKSTKASKKTEGEDK
ncbi:50S ribosomal protein L22 [Helicobacter sp. 12S02232-10]|uniref:50S ribosomal protein L22 n=1 Tax=Helicobacter sp. 12S02232-10 TaxID=1476197 RepID=UPI000BA73C27|nr:50S ribosomal protein L22 [Helicobacter sp. 12S02232-10]PAF48292.1 50S ribosomal protein L22 [Helicobacter sp. 12S02232-10]